MSPSFILITFLFSFWNSTSFNMESDMFKLVLESPGSKEERSSSYIIDQLVKRSIRNRGEGVMYRG